MDYSRSTGHHRQSLAPHLSTRSIGFAVVSVLVLLVSVVTAHAETRIINIPAANNIKCSSTVHIGGYSGLYYPGGSDVFYRGNSTYLRWTGTGGGFDFAQCYIAFTHGSVREVMEWLDVTATATVTVRANSVRVHAQYKGCVLFICGGDVKDVKNGNVSRNLIKDALAPIITLTTEGVARVWRGGPATLSFYIDDPLSGVKVQRYRTRHNGGAWSGWTNLIGATPRVTVSQDGVTDIQVNAQDRVGNSRTENFAIMIDTVAPYPVDPQTTQITVDTAPDGSLGSVDVTWGTVEDRPFAEPYHSGLLRYDVGFSQTGTFNANYQPAAPEVSAAVSDLQRDVHYEIGVAPVDSVPSTPNGVGEYGVVGAFVIPSALRISAVEYAQPFVDNGAPVYPLQVVFDGGLEVLAEIGGVELWRDGVPTPLFDGSVAELLADPRWSTEERETGQVLVFADVLTGVEHAHQRYGYRTFTNHAIAIGAPRELGNVFPGVDELGNPLAAPIVPNSLPPFIIAVRGGADPTDPLLDRLDVDGYRAGGGGSSEVVTLFPSTPVFFHLEAAGGATDVEGDGLRFRLVTINDTPLSDWALAGTPIEFFRNTSQTYQAYLEVEETTTVGGFGEVALGHPELYGAEYVGQATAHGSGAGREGFYVSFDFEAAAAAFVLNEAGTGRELGESEPTATTSVRLQVPAGAITDATGAVDSGVSSATVWNLDTDGVGLPDYLVEEDLAALATTAAGAKTDLQVSSAPGVAAPAVAIDQGWELIGSAEPVEALRVVVMEVLDGAGNTRYSWRVVGLDTIAPAAVELDTFAHVHGADTLAVSWASPQPEAALSYRVELPQPAGTTATLSTTSPTAALATAGFGANVALPMSVTAIDAAGNASEAAAYLPYTLAELPVLGAPQHQYDEGFGGHQIGWSASGGAYADLFLEVLDAADGAVVDQIVAAGDALLHTGLAPHTSYTYRLVATNGFVPADAMTTVGVGDRSVAAPFSEQAANRAPSAPMATQPAAFATLAPTFRFTPSVDVDGDPLTYRLYLEPAGGGTATLVGTTTSAAGVFPEPGDSLPAGLLVHGGGYQWYVVADDTADAGYTGEPYGALTTQGAAVAFVADGVAPTAAFTDQPAALFANLAALSVAVDDDLSGVEALAYWTSDDVVPASAPQVAAVTGGNGALALHDGTYRVTAQVTDAAGNVTTSTSNELRIDRVAPVVSGVTVDLPSASGRLLAASGAVGSTVTVTDEFAGPATLRYGFATSAAGTVDVWRTLPLEPAPQPDGILGPRTYEVALNLPLAAGDYWLVTEADDFAGNRSAQRRATEPIRYDPSPPTVAVAVDGLTAHGGSLYAADLAQVVPVVTAADTDSGASVDFGVAAIGAQPTQWHPTWSAAASAAATALVAGEQYQAFGRAVNGVGATTAAGSVPFAYDPTAPTAVSLAGLPAAAQLVGEQVRLQVTAADTESRLSLVRVAVGSAGGAGSADLTAQVSGHVGGWLEATPLEPATPIAFEVPDVADGSYEVTVEVRNGAGLVTQHAAGAFTVQRQQQRVVVADEGPFSPFADQLSGSWRWAGAPDAASYDYRVMSGAGELVPWTATATEAATATGLALADGTEYWFEARAHLVDASVSPVARSSGVVVDTTAPAFAVAAFARPDLAAPDGVWLSWQASDAESGIAGVQALLERPDGAGGRLPVGAGWISLAASVDGNQVAVRGDASGAALPLDGVQRVYPTIRVTNGAGLSVDHAGEPIFIDSTPPPEPPVIDQGELINPAQLPEAQWVFAGDDPESGPAQYRWTVVRNPADLSSAVWVDDDGSRRADVAAAAPVIGTLEPVHGETWYFVVNAINGAGLESRGVSNGITYDATAPLIAEVRLVDAVSDPATAPDRAYVAATSGLRAFVDAVEDEATIASYTVVHGSWDVALEFTTAGAGETYVSVDPLVPLTSPEPGWATDAISVLQAEVDSSAGLTSERGYSTGVIYDPLPPVVQPLSGYLSADLLVFDWDGAADRAPIVGYEVSLVSAGALPAAWSDLGLDRTASFDAAALALADGVYELAIRARNAAGTRSAVARSPAVMLDRTPPVIGATAADPFAALEVTVDVAASDALSGIAEYEVALGTLADATALTGGWRSVVTGATSTQVAFDFAALPGGLASVPDGAQIYASARARDRAGLWSALSRSAAIVIDKSTAAAPAVTAPAYTNDALTVRGAGFTAADGQSGITHYRIAAVAAPGPVDPGDWVEVVVAAPGAAPTVTVDGLVVAGAFVHGSQAHIAVTARNGARLWSPAGFSGPVAVDLQPPSVTFTAAQPVVVNEPPVQLPYQVAEDVSTAVDITFTVVRPDGSADELPAVRRTPGAYELTFDYGEPGQYVVQVEAVDSAGNRLLELAALPVRVNAPPEITLVPHTTTPGAPLQLSAFVFDPDGDQPFTYSWDLFADGTELRSAATPTYAYLHRDPLDPETSYAVSLTVTDSAGKSAAATTTVTVRNTESGQLYVDEYWSGLHQMRGDVTVPPGLTLTVLPATQVVVTGSVLAGYDHRLAVLGTLVADGASFAIEEGRFETWNGIYVEGSASLNGATIADAERGLAVIGSAAVALTGSRFIDNDTGVHVVGATLTINASELSGSRRYGVKEDAGAVVTVLDSVFTGNLFDYYEPEQTVITASEVNGRNGSSGNVTDKGAGTP